MRKYDINEIRIPDWGGDILPTFEVYGYKIKMLTFLLTEQLGNILLL